MPLFLFQVFFRALFMIPFLACTATNNSTRNKWLTLLTCTLSYFSKLIKKIIDHVGSWWILAGKTPFYELFQSKILNPKQLYFHWAFEIWNFKNGWFFGKYLFRDVSTVKAIFFKQINLKFEWTKLKKINTSTIHKKVLC